MIAVIQKIRIVVAVTLVLMPFLSWVFGGASGQYSQRDQVAFPEVRDLFAPSVQGRNALSDALADRSEARREAIRFLNTLRWRVLGFIDNDRIASGADGYLFYKEQFTEWSCAERDRNAVHLDQLLMLLEVADASAADFTLIVAPNKATVMREKVRGRAALLLDCYDETAARLRHILSLAPRGMVVDHSQSMLIRPDRDDSFFRTDTHWKTEPAQDAFRTFLELTNGRFGSGFEVSDAGSKAVKTDLAGTMLQLSMTESDKNLIPSPLDGLSSGEHGSIVLVHDSFYARIRPSVAVGMHPHYLHFAYISDADQLDQELQVAQTVGFERVERRLLDELQPNFMLGEGGALRSWIMTKSRDASTDCRYDSPVSTDHVSMRRVSGDSFDSLMAERSNPILEVTLPDYAKTSPFCLGIVVRKDGDTRTRLYLPGSHFARLYGQYSEGRVLAFSGEDRVEIGLLLPPIPEGEIRLDPVNTPGAFAIEKLAFGRKRP